MEKLKNFWNKYKSFFFIFLFCASIIFYLSRRVIINESEMVKLQLELIQKDTLLKISDGKYRKVVNFYANKKDLTNGVKSSAPEIFNEITKNKEKILSNTGISFTFKSKDSSSVITKKDSLYNFTSYYPNEQDYFVKYKGILNTNNNKLTEKWDFSNINIDVILTQKENGLWNSYLNAPDYVKVNKMEINSLPPKQYIPEANKIKTFNFYGGLGVRTNVNALKSVADKDLTINGALTIKNKVMIEANIGTDKKVGGAILFKF